MRLRASGNYHSTWTVRRGDVARAALSMLLLVAVIGGIAWVVQYLPTREAKKPELPPPPSEKASLEFVRWIAQWYPPRLSAKKEGEEGASLADQFPPKDFEQGTNGHYDFVFKNVADKDVDIVFYTSDCDCNSVEVCGLASGEVERLGKFNADKSGEPLPYANPPEMKKLAREVTADPVLRVPPGAGGVVRVTFNAKKSPGQSLNVRPKIWYQPAGQPTQRIAQSFVVPVMVRQPVNFHPQRVSVGILTADAAAEGKLVAWSSTREDLNLKLGNDDPSFQIKIEPLAKEDYTPLGNTLIAEKNTATVRSAVQVTVTVHESVKGKQLDLGSFYRKLPVYLDGVLNTDVQGPEIVGRVEGNLMIGGADDFGRVRFKSFDAEIGGKKIVEISADEKAELKAFSHQPSWVEVSLKLDKKHTPPPKRRIWILEARVPANTPAIRSFEEPDAIVLQVTTGKTVRMVRIPLEGHIGGQ